MLKLWWNFVKAKRALQGFYAVPDESNLATVLVLLNKLSPEYKEQLLSFKNKNGYNFVQFAVQHYPAALDPLLNVLTTLDLKVQARIFLAKIPRLKVFADLSNRHFSYESKWTQDEIRKQLPSDTTAGDWNVLEMAVRFQPKLVAPLLSAINNFDSHSQVALFTRSNEYLGALQLAATHHPDVLESLLKAIAKLKPKYHKQVVADISKEESCFIYSGYRGGKFNFYPHHINNRVAIARRWQKEEVAAWLKIIASLENKAQDKMLNGLTQVLQKALPEAAAKNPEAMIQILDIITILDSKTQIKIYTFNRTLLEHNALQIAASKAVKPLLKAIETLDNETKANIFCHTTYGQNALQIHIEKRHINEVKQILKAISKLDSKYQARILCNRTDSYNHSAGLNALQFTAYFAPELIDSVLDAMSRLDPAIALVIFANKNEKGETVTDIASQRCPEFIARIKDAENKALQNQSQKLKSPEEACSISRASSHKPPKNAAFFGESMKSQPINVDRTRTRKLLG